MLEKIIKGLFMPKTANRRFLDMDSCEKIKYLKSVAEGKKGYCSKYDERKLENRIKNMHYYAKSIAKDRIQQDDELYNNYQKIDGTLKHIKIKEKIYRKKMDKRNYRIFSGTIKKLEDYRLKAFCKVNKIPEKFRVGKSAYISKIEEIISGSENKRERYCSRFERINSIIKMNSVNGVEDVLAIEDLLYSVGKNRYLRKKLEETPELAKKISEFRELCMKTPIMNKEYNYVLAKKLSRWTYFNKKSVYL